MKSEVRDPGRSNFFGVPSGQVLYGSDEFFDQAVAILKQSTQQKAELAGAVVAEEVNGKFLLVGLTQKETGSQRHVMVQSDWGSLLWHTHPGFSGTIAAFSEDDLEVARTSGRPLLVIGYGSLSIEVLSTLALPLGRRAFFISAGLKGLMWLENKDKIPTRLLEKGVAVRVCYPDGVIQPVLRMNSSPAERAVGEVGFMLDKSVGYLERQGQSLAKRLFSMLGPGD